MREEKRRADFAGQFTNETAPTALTPRFGGEHPRFSMGRRKDIDESDGRAAGSVSASS